MCIFLSLFTFFFLLECTEDDDCEGDNKVCHTTTGDCKCPHGFAEDDNGDCKMGNI